MEMLLQRLPTMNTRRGLTTFGSWFIEGVFYCRTLEDAIIEDPDPSTPQNEAKVDGETAMSPGRFQLDLRDSPKFGPETIFVLGVKSHTDVRVHGGMTIESTRGCPIVGDVVDYAAGTIAGAKARGVLVGLKKAIQDALWRGQKVWLTVEDPPKEVAL